MEKVFGFLLLSIILLGLIHPSSIGAQADAIDSIFIREFSSETNFPVMSANFYGLTSNSRIAANLSQADIHVYEDNTRVEAFEFQKSDQVLPTYTIFIIDNGYFSNYDSIQTNLKASINQYISQYFRNNLDSVELWETANTPQEAVKHVVIERTSSASDFVQRLNNVNLEGTDENTQGLDAVNDAVNRLISLPDMIPGTASIVLVTRFFDNNVYSTSVATARAEEIASLAHDHHIRIYTLHTDYNGRLSEPLNILADKTQGAYVDLRPMLGGQVVPDLTAVYQDINAQRTTYNIVYNSSIRETRTGVPFTIVPASVPTSNAADVKTFSIDLSPPVLAIQQPQQGAVISRIDNNGSGVFTPNEYSIQASLSWPANSKTRTVNRVSLIVDGREQQILSELPNPNNIVFTWDISDFKEPNSESAALLEIQVEDNLGVITTSEPINVIIETTYIPPTPVQMVTTVVGEINPCDDDPGGVECRTRQAKEIAPWALVGLIIVASAIVVIPMRRQIKKLSENPTSRAGKLLRKLDETIRGKKSPPRATLTVVRGPAHALNRTISMYGTLKEKISFGRDPEMAQVHFYEDETGSSVSRKHCEIVYDQGEFKVIDSNSANGTYVNDQEISGIHVLKDGDIIRLGMALQREVEMRFKLLALDITEIPEYPIGQKEDPDVTTRFKERQNTPVPAQPSPGALDSFEQDMDNTEKHPKKRDDFKTQPVAKPSIQGKEWRKWLREGDEEEKKG